MDLTNMRVSVAAAGLPGRYAAALFDLALQGEALDATATDLATLRDVLAESAELREVTTSPAISREVAGKTVAALAGSLGLNALTAKFLGVLAQNGRLASLSDIISQFNVILNAHNGTVVAEVISATKLTAAQKKALETKLKTRTGQVVAVDLKVDPSLLGGLIVRIGSEQIDTSIKTRLERLGQQLKGQ